MFKIIKKTLLAGLLLIVVVEPVQVNAISIGGRIISFIGGVALVCLTFTYGSLDNCKELCLNGGYGKNNFENGASFLRDRLKYGAVGVIETGFSLLGIFCVLEYSKCLLRRAFRN